MLSVDSAVEKIDEKTLMVFRGAADKLIEEKGATDALAAALAIVCGATTEIQSRSLINGKKVDSFSVRILPLAFRDTTRDYDFCCRVTQHIR